jgi:hypothetical protein
MSVSRLYYFTIEDEGMLSEAFAKLERETFAIAYKVYGTDDVFVTTSRTKEAMDREDVPYNLLAEEDGSRISLFHSALSREELSELEEPLKALALAYRAIAAACVGVNGETDLGFDLSNGSKRYTYFTAPAGHTFIWRLFHTRREAVRFSSKLPRLERRAVDWAQGIPLSSSRELAGYH